MANVSRIVGAEHIHSLMGTYNSIIHPYLIASTDVTACFIGDFVKTTGDNLFYAPSGSYHPVITQAAATDTLRGFIVGFEPERGDLSLNYRKASSLRLVYVCDDPYALFILQRDGTSALTDVGKNADIVVGAGNIITGTSGMYLSGTVGAGSAQIRILGVDPRPNNGVLDTYTKYICMINEHELKSTTGV